MPVDDSSVSQGPPNIILSSAKYARGGEAVAQQDESVSDRRKSLRAASVVQTNGDVSRKTASEHKEAGESQTAKALSVAGNQISGEDGTQGGQGGNGASNGRKGDVSGDNRGPWRLRRRGAMSDLWQQQGAFRSNRQSMKSMFEEFSAELRAPHNAGLSKAVVGDIFTYTAVGYKHVVNELPSEDRIAIHQAVVPTIDEETKAELGLESIDKTPFAMFAVFDGHGGPACAEFLTQSVATVLRHSPVLYDEDLTPFERRACATADSFEELEKVHNSWAHETGDLSGSTAILSTFQDGVLVMAGVGDSAGLYVDHLGTNHTLCPQHSTHNAREVERVLNMGGTIIDGRVAGCLMPTRTIGDLDCKRAMGAIVSPHPELKLAAIYAPPDDGNFYDDPFLVLASDGLWDVLSNEEVSFLTRKGLRMLRAYTSKADRKKDRENKKDKVKGATKENKRRGGGEDEGEQGAERKTGLKSFFSRRSKRDRGSKDGERRAGDGLSALGGETAAPASGTPLDVSRSSRWSNFTDDSKNNRRSKEDQFLDHSRKGLDASVHVVGAPIKSATLDESLYAGLRTQTAGDAVPDPHTDVEASVDRSDPSAPKLVAVSSTSATASVRTAGLRSHNVAMQLVDAALRENSRDDISVVVVTFHAGPDKGPPGSGQAKEGGSSAYFESQS